MFDVMVECWSIHYISGRMRPYHKTLRRKKKWILLQSIQQRFGWLKNKFSSTFAPMPKLTQTWSMQLCGRLPITNSFCSIRKQIGRKCTIQNALAAQRNQKQFVLFGIWQLCVCVWHEQKQKQNHMASISTLWLWLQLWFYDNLLRHFI